METDLRAASTIVDAQSAVSWGAIAAGAVGAAALALLLIAFGAGLGLSAVSPWSDSGVSASTFKTGTGIYLVIVAVMSSAVGGYLAARLRTKWVGVHTHEVFFRDTAHGFIAWAFATLLSATALSSVTGYLANGAAAGVGGAASQAARSVNPADIYVDKLFRPDTAGTASIRACLVTRCRQPNSCRAERRKFQSIAGGSPAVVDREFSGQSRPQRRRQNLCGASRGCSHRHEPGRCRKARQ